MEAGETATTVAGSTQATAARVLILGDAADQGEALIRRLRESGGDGACAVGSDSELTTTLSEPRWTTVAVITHDDALALRLTLLSAHVRPDLPLWATLFDRTLVHRLHEVAPTVNVLATADLVAEVLADHCQAFPHAAGDPFSSRGRIVDDALRLMVIAGGGLVATLVVQSVITMISVHDGLVDAVYFSTRAIATVADVPRANSAPDWFKLLSTLTTVVAVVLLAVFTAALVRRLNRPRLTTLYGRRRAPGRGHALVIGFGQIGFRLAQELRRRDVPVLAMEQDVNAPCVRLARRAGIPVIIGRGDDRAMLEMAGVERCAVVVAVTSSDLSNVAIGMSASDVRSGVPLVLRLGDGNVAAETESLLHMGRICDATGLIAAALADAIIAGGTAPLTGEACHVRPPL